MTTATFNPREQRMTALALANEVRTTRARLLAELRRGEVRFPDFDLDHPTIQGVTVFDLVEAVRTRRDVSSTRYPRTQSTRLAEKVVRRMGTGYRTTVGDLSPARKDALRTLVADFSTAQRPER